MTDHSYKSQAAQTHNTNLRTRFGRHLVEAERGSTQVAHSEGSTCCSNFSYAIKYKLENCLLIID